MAEKKKVVKKTVSKRPKLRVSDLVINDEYKPIPEEANGTIAAQLLLSIPRGILIVVDKGGKKALGVITAREFLKAISDGNNPAKMPVKRLMNTDVYEIKLHELLDNVVPKIKERDPYAVIVVDKDGKFQGYFSPMDYQEALARINYVPPK